MVVHCYYLPLSPNRIPGGELLPGHPKSPLGRGADPEVSGRGGVGKFSNGIEFYFTHLVSKFLKHSDAEHGQEMKVGYHKYNAHSQ